METTKYVTNNEDIFFIGTKDGEEYYQKLNETGGWSFMGLRPETEDNLREYCRNTDPEEYGAIPSFMQQYFDYDKWADDMEEQWEERHDVQATRKNEEGEILYLGFGSGQGAKGYFAKNKIETYKDYCNYFDEIGLTEKEFKIFIKDYVK